MPNDTEKRCPNPLVIKNANEHNNETPCCENLSFISRFGKNRGEGSPKL